MPNPEVPRTTVQGRVDGGKVYCSCNRNVGLITDSGVEFFCRHCHVNVMVDLRHSKLEKLARVAELMAAV